MKQRAFSKMTVKSVDEDERIVVGVASSIRPDRQEDILEPKGAKFKLPLPLLWQHSAHMPVGHVIEATVSENEIEVVTQFAKASESRTLRERLEEAWESVKLRLVAGFSVGFVALESEPIKGTAWGMRIKSWEWLELSAVTIPANADATIENVKLAFARAKGMGYPLPRVPAQYDRACDDGSFKLR